MNVHPKIIATGIVCISILAAFTVYAERTALFGGSHINNVTTNVPGSTPGILTVSNPNTTQGTEASWQKSLDQNIAHSTSSVQILTTGTSDTSADDNTLTAQLSKQFFSLYLADQKNGVTIDDAEAQNIAAQALANVSLTSTAKQYTVKDVKVSQDNSVAGINVYGNKLASLANTYFPPQTPNPLTLLGTAIQSNNEKDAAKLDTVVNGYQKLLHDTLLVQVPQKILGYHILYINTLSSLLLDVQEMRHVVSDPVTGYIGFTDYQKDIITLQAVINRMDTKLSF